MDRWKMAKSQERGPKNAIAMFEQKPTTTTTKATTKKKNKNCVCTSFPSPKLLHTGINLVGESTWLLLLHRKKNILNAVRWMFIACWWGPLLTPVAWKTRNRSEGSCVRPAESDRSLGRYGDLLDICCWLASFFCIYFIIYLAKCMWITWHAHTTIHKTELNTGSVELVICTAETRVTTLLIRKILSGPRNYYDIVPAEWAKIWLWPRDKSREYSYYIVQFGFNSRLIWFCARF